MADWGSKPVSKPDGTTKKRWEKILDLSGSTAMYDLSTGKAYKIEQFVPLYDDTYKSVVNNFKLKGTNETVYVPFLRLVGDGRDCSLMRKL